MKFALLREIKNISSGVLSELLLKTHYKIHCVKSRTMYLDFPSISKTY